MKKFLRTLCVGFVAMCVASASFAQTENVTSKLVNPDMESDVIGWNIDLNSGRFKWAKNTKDQATQRGYHGMNNTVLEYTANTGLRDNTISQTVDSLPNGTYVFGAYVGASQQGSKEPNRETVVGVTMFANDSSVAVATNDPSYSAAKWAHTAKFNVATTVSDGTLTVGLKAEDTNANFLIMDNATLYYFGDMDEAAALDEMAKIDMAATVAIADTCLAYHMNVDSLALITEAKAAAEAVATADAAWQADEDLYWAIFKANRSIADYRSFSNAIAAANVVAAGEWTDYVGGELESLHSYIDEAEDLYEAATMNREEIEAKVSMLNEAAALVTLDSCYVMIDMCYEALDEGEYSEDVYIEVENLLEDVGYALERVYEGFSAIEVKKECDLLFAQIQELLNNPNSFYDEFPILLERDPETEFTTNGNTCAYLKGTVLNENQVLTYTSKLFRFQEPLSRIRFIVKESGSNQLTGDYPFFTLSSFEMFDAEGNEIELSEDMITSNACHNTLNSSLDGDGIPALVDDNPSTFFHSTWGNAVYEYHYLEVTLPEGEYTAFRFVMNARSNINNHQFPATIEIVAPSVVVEDILRPVVNEAKEMNPYRGTDPGFYNTDLTAFYTALANAEALLGGNASDDAVIAAAEALADEIDLLQSCMVMPEPGKQYHIVSAAPFFENQGAHKAWTAYSDFDSGLVNHVWWETARPDSPEQLFTFEAIPDEEGKYYVKNVSTGLYVGTPYTDYGDVLNAVALFEEADAVELQPLGYGQFGLFNNGMIHAGDHNNGVYSEITGYYGGILGVYSSLVKWNDHSAYNPSAWYIREMSELPFEMQVDNTIPYRSATIHLYSGVSAITLTADTDCAFDGLVVYDLLDNEQPANISVQGNTALVQLEDMMESFSFAFNNYESVATLTIGGGISKISELREAYDAAVAIAPVEGKHIMQYSDLDEYEEALAYANGLLTDGGTDEEMMTAIAMIEDAVANLQPNLPLPDHTYYIVSAHPGFYEQHGVNMMMYADEWEPRWTYENTQEHNRRWLFEPAEGEDGYYLKNVATEMYLGCSDYLSSLISMVGSKEETVPYVVSSLSGDIVAIAANTSENASLHANGHRSGAGAEGSIVYWYPGVGTASAWRICDTKLYGMEELYAMSVKNVSANSPALITIPIELENTGEVTAFQFDLCLPDGFTVVQNEGGYDISFNSERVTANHKLTVESQADGVLRITGSSTSNEVFFGEEGAIVNVNVAVDRSVLKGNYAVALRNICITKSDATEVLAEDDTATLSIKESLVELLETLQAAKDTFTAGLLELDSLGLGDATDRLNQHYNEVNDTIDENSIESVKTKIQSIKQLTKECEAELAAYYRLQEQLAKLQTTRAAFAECIANLEELNLIGISDALMLKYEEVSDVDEGSIEAVMEEILRIEQLLDEYASGMNAYQRLAKLIADCEGYALQFPIEEFIAAIDAAKAVIEDSMSTTEDFVEAYDALYDMCAEYVGLIRVHVDNPGMLYAMLLQQTGSFNAVERLEVSGTLNDNDLYCIRYDLWALKEIDMSAAEVTYLHNEQFAYHDELTDVVLPATLSRIGGNAFEGCHNLQSVTCPALAPPYVDYGFGEVVSNGLVTLYVPEWTITMYKLEERWDDFMIIEPIDNYYPERISVNQDFTLTIPETLPVGYKPELSIDWSDLLGKQSSLTVEGTSALALKKFGLGYDVEWEKRVNGEYITHATLINHVEMSADSISIWVEITNDAWSFLSFPFDVKVADIMPTQPNTSYAIRKYSGKNRAEQNFGNTWQDMTADSVLHSGEGYIWQSSSYDSYGYWQETSAFIVSAMDNEKKNQIFAHTDCVVALNEYIAESADDCSWNLIGNPYPSYYDTREMDFTAPITVWNMHYNSYYAYSPIDDEYILRPGEAFFVQCPTGTEAITFRADGRQADRVVRERATQAKAYARNADERQVFNLTLSNGEMDDRTRIVINPAAACDYEMNCDASKFMSSDARVPQLYTVNNGMKLAINERPLSDGVVSLGAYFGSKGSYTIALDTKVEGMSVVLVDKVTGMETDLMNTTYTFTAEAGAVDNRFAICLRAGEEGDATGCDALSGQVSVKAAGRQIVVTAPSVSPIEVYNVDGHRIATATATSAVVDVEPGVYVVKVQAYVHKVVIK